MSTKKVRPAGTWYAPNSREPVRDETIRTGFIPCRAVIERTGVPTTSAKPKYALNAVFASLFNPELTDEALDHAIQVWQAAHLSKAAMSRVRLSREGRCARDLSKRGDAIAFPRPIERHREGGDRSVRTAFPEAADRALAL